MTLILALPPAVLELNQEHLLERAFHDGLYPNLAFRAEATFENWPEGAGNEIYQTRPGLLAPVTKPLKPGTDPTPDQMVYEQWKAVLEQFAGTMDTHMPTAKTAAANLLMRNIHQQGLQAGQSVNRLARNSLFKAYLGGNTLLTSATLVGDTQLQVASANGFTEVINVGSNVAPKGVSAAAPLSITIGSGTSAVKRFVVGVVLANPDDAYGPATLLLSAAIGTAFPARTAVKSFCASKIVRASGGDSVDAIGAGDTMVLQQAINAVAFLRKANVQPHDDGFYHAHISPISNAQVFADPVFQRLNQSLPEGVAYKEGFLGTLSGVMFFMNTESPDAENSGARTPTGTLAQYSEDIGAETTNEAGIDIGRVVITGKGCLYERGFDESAFVTEAGTTGKIGEFDVVNNGLSIMTERIRLILQAPMDRLQQKVAHSWSISTSFPVPSDITAQGGPSRFKRAIVLEHALTG